MQARDFRRVIHMNADRLRRSALRRWMAVIRSDWIGYRAVDRMVGAVKQWLLRCGWHDWKVVVRSDARVRPTPHPRTHRRIGPTDGRRALASDATSCAVFAVRCDGRRSSARCTDFSG